MNVNISIKSKKLGSIPTINLLASASCRKNAPCAKGCYAKKGNFQRDNVIKPHLENYLLYNENAEGFFQEINKFLNSGIVIYKYFRYHMAGDIVDMKYLYEMIKLANANKQTKFLCFTKKYELVNLYLSVNKTLPKNLIVVLSYWDNTFKVENPFNLPVAYVDFKKKSRNVEIPNNAKECNGDCTNCLKCWNLKKGESVKFEYH